MQGLTGETRSGSSSYAPAHRPKSAETTNDEPFWDYVQSFVIVRRTQVVFVNRSADSAAEVRASLFWSLRSRTPPSTLERWQRRGSPYPWPRPSDRAIEITRT